MTGHAPPRKGAAGRTGGVYVLYVGGKGGKEGGRQERTRAKLHQRQNQVQMKRVGLLELQHNLGRGLRRPGVLED